MKEQAGTSTRRLLLQQAILASGAAALAKAADETSATGNAAKEPAWKRSSRPASGTSG